MVNENDSLGVQDEVQIIKDAFQKFDVNGDGFMNKDELKYLLHQIGMNFIVFSQSYKVDISYNNKV